MSFENIGKRETLPEKVSKVIKESILNGELKGGEALPTEPELEKQFGVSRAVVRDAVRMLKAQGLIEVQHGKGMFVTTSQMEAFTDALLTTLRRDNASVWDVEQFERIFLPQVFALAAESAAKKEVEKIRSLADSYLAAGRRQIDAEIKGDVGEIAEVSQQISDEYRAFLTAVLDATGNKMIRLVGEVLLSLRKNRHISDCDHESVFNVEKAAFRIFVDAVASGDPKFASETVSRLLTYDEKIAEIMRITPVGTSPDIPGDLFIRSYKI